MPKKPACKITVKQGKTTRSFPMTSAGIRKAQALVTKLLKTGKVGVSGRWSCVKKVV